MNVQETRAELGVSRSTFYDSRAPTRSSALLRAAQTAT